MRNYLEECLDREELNVFPAAATAVRRYELKHLFVHVFCVCGLPESYDSRMIECETCEKWFHYKCMGLMCEPEVWSCPNCTEQ